tara:strand:- start:10450 stop:12399 length:1950 start_codon:yes stop_codon:yes gene_type:complete
MLHTANTASIKLNSNVVTEFPRSKKLIKYPRVALTANSSGGYVASANSEYHNDYAAFRAFNNKGPGYDYGATIGWEPANISTFNSSGTWVGSTSSSANTTITLEGGNTIYGEWLQIQLPTKIRLEYVNFLPLKNTSHAMAHRAPRAGYILGSNNGTNWTALKDWSGIVYETWTAYYHKFYKFDIDKEVDNYQYFRFVWTETAGTSTLSEYASGQELEFWGVPEYDPEAAGVDIKMTSYPNVPNTDWLKVYYDAKDLDNGAVTTVDDLTPSGTNDGTAYGGVTASDGSFVLDGTNDYITTPALGFSGDQAHSVSLWFWSDKPHSDMTTEHGLYCIGRSTNPLNGTNSARGGLSFWSPVTYPNNPLRYWHSNNHGTNFKDALIIENTWNHVIVVYPGNGVSNIRVWLNGVERDGVYAGSTNNDFAWDTNDHIIVGDWYTSTGTVKLQSPWDGKIANFRLFNRPLSRDEIYQLYAYQKEYFGHGDLGMTLKAGRLGIGTSEPRAALDVRGDIYGGCPVFFRVRKSTDTLQGANPIIWNEIMVNKGSGYSTITGKFTAPVSGYYEFIYGGCSGRTDWSAEIHAHKNNGSRIEGASAYAAGGTNPGHWGRQMMNTVILELNVGETFHLSQPSGNQDMTGGTYSYNFFSGKYLSN